MVVKLNSLSRWRVLDAKNGIAFKGSRVSERRVRIDFNCEAVTAFYIGFPEGERFLCTLQPGLETVEFNALGNFTVFAEEGSADVHFQTAEFESSAFEVVDPKIFTKLAGRRTRNPELEEMMWRVNANMERRLASQAAEFEAVLAAQLRAAEAARNAVDKGTGAQPPAKEVSTQKPAGEESSGETGSPDDGEQQSA